MFGKRTTAPQVNVSFAPARTEYVTREVNVHEHRAPTDESVKLLREMEASARQEIVQAIKVEGNGFNCVVHIHQDMISDGMIARAIYDLNGRRFEDQIDVQWRNKTPEGLISALVAKVSETIGREVLKDALSASLRGIDARSFYRDGGS